MGEHLRVQNQAVEITISEQPGIAPESIRINRAATRDLLPPLQEPKQYEFSLHSSAPQMVADSTKAAFINLDFAM